ncbi:SulP family inorganic anion transporter [Streptomyces sp. HNM0575]|uniref:SulP family inorganic anion transporter n=1 Tax=Streptomyces sp. HNM0575 TaxID=2716338 RepID=UPI00145C451D|nr:SulP family inorganic anion transporter [Streptomyces sp. HNM0575]NLU75416.1 SulP family inorganic anion transporter [Streptomyces sp. HNM0575]
MSSSKPSPTSSPKPGVRTVLRADVTASLVVFLVALPLCVGIAFASGVPAELGLVTGIVGGLVTGLLPGSSLQVSGPAAGLAVLVYEAVQSYGLGVLGVLVLGAGLLQLAMGALRLGRWFRAISVAVVQGMLAGIGLVLIAGQVYALVGAEAPGTGLGKLAGLPGLVAGLLGGETAPAAALLGAGTVAVLVLWPKWRPGARVLPAPLAAVGLATAVTAVFGLPVERVRVRGLLEAVQPPGAGDFGALLSPGVLATVAAFTLIASAESLFSAAAVDRLHGGPRTDYDRELMAQGAGNAVCGVLGALPMTAVIVRSSANVSAGARTKASRVLHGVWLLLFAAALPWALGVIPVAALAGVLVHAGWKLIPVRELGPLWREHRAEAVVLGVTALAIVGINMFEGVLIGLLLAVVKSAWEISHVQVETEEPGRDSGRGAGQDGGVGAGAGPGAGAGSGAAAGGDARLALRVRVLGNATFLRLPKLLDQLEALPYDRRVELDLAGLRHVDHACGTALAAWEAQHNSRAAAAGSEVRGSADAAGTAGGGPSAPGVRPADAGHAPHD